jgi:hypothetical protein
MTLPATDSTAPTGTVAINGGGATTGSSSVTMSVAATDAGSGMALVRLSNSNAVDGNGVLSGTGSTSYTYTPSIAWNLEAGLGTKTVYAQWRDAAGNWSAVASDAIEVTDDATPPSAPASVTYTLAGSGGFTIPVRLAWPAATDNQGVTGYQITRSINGGGFTEIVADQPGLTLYMGLSNTSATYSFCVRAKDAAGNPSSPRCTPTFRATSYSESNTALRFSGSWSLSSSTVYIGGKAKVSSTRNASVTMNFTGNRVGWYAKTGPTYGQARVYINGVLVKTVNLNSATDQTRRLVFSKSFGSIATRSIKIVVVGTAGHPKVVVDQLFVLR